MKKLKDYEDKNVSYPPELRSSTRAEYTTRVRTNQKKPGCRDILAGVLVIILAIFLLLS